MHGGRGGCPDACRRHRALMLPETLRAATGQRVFVQPSVRPGASLPLVQVRILTAPPAHSSSATTSSSIEVLGEPNTEAPHQCFSPVAVSESAPDERSGNDLSGQAHLSSSRPSVDCRKTLSVWDVLECRERLAKTERRAPQLRVACHVAAHGPACTCMPADVNFWAARFCCDSLHSPPWTSKL